MQEDKIEQLEKMFPRGFVIVYTFDNSDDMRVYFYNPHRYESIKFYADLIEKHDMDVDEL